MNNPWDCKLPSGKPNLKCYRFSQVHIRFINNEFVKGVEGRTFETINPHNEKPIVAVHEGTAKDVDIAVKTARKALEGQWKRITPSERGRLLTRLADFLE